MKFVIKILFIYSVALLAACTVHLNRSGRSINQKNEEFYSGVFKTMADAATAKKLENYMKECGNFNMVESINKLRTDLNRINNSSNQNDTIFCAKSVRYTVKALLSNFRKCKLVHDYFKSWLLELFKLFVKSEQLGNDVVQDPVMKTIYGGISSFKKDFDDFYSKRRFDAIGQKFVNLMKQIRPN